MPDASSCFPGGNLLPRAPRRGANQCGTCRNFKAAPPDPAHLGKPPMGFCTAHPPQATMIVVAVAKTGQPHYAPAATFPPVSADSGCGEWSA